MDISKLDIVYVVKDAAYNDELRYSLRSVEKNFPHHRVVFIGGKPMGLHPDYQIIMNQKGDTKWDKVRTMLELVGKNDNLTEDFVLFNDDFFILKPVENFRNCRYGTLTQLCHRIERKNFGKPTGYTKSLARTIKALENNGLTTLNFELHIPMALNRKKLLETIESFPDTKGTRSLYGNMYFSKKDTKPLKDVKIYDQDSLPKEDQTFLSTEDHSFATGRAGRFIKKMFPDKSRWEK